jgi:hypothetical protein
MLSRNNSVIHFHCVLHVCFFLRYNPEGRGFDSRWCNWKFFIDKLPPAALWPWVDSAINRNEYQEYFLGVKAAGAYGWQSCHVHVSTVLKSGSLNLLEPWGPVQACIGVAFPFMPFFLSNANKKLQKCVDHRYIYFQLLLHVSASNSVPGDAILIPQEGLQDL